MAPNLFKNNLIHHVYHLINEKAEVCDEGDSVKAVLDQASSDTSSTEPLLAKRESFYHYNHCNGIILIFNIAMFCLSVTMFGSGYRLVKPDDPFDNGILRKSSEYSPIFDQIHIPVVKIKRNGSFTDPPHPSIYRQPPSPEVDAAWARLGNINPIHMNSEDVRK